MIEEAVISYLLDNMGVKAVVGNRVFPVSRPQGSSLPAITAHRIDGAPLQADEGLLGLEPVRMQFDCWGANYSAAKTAARAVISAINAFDGNMGSVAVSLVELEAERDLPRETGINASEYLFRTSLDFTIWHSS
jgi:hypothetical protein